MCDLDFCCIKDSTANVASLKEFDTNTDSITTTDASNKGLGAVLTQVGEEGIEFVVAYASKSLSPTEERYSVIEKETLPCVPRQRTILEHWYGETFY